MGIRGVIAGLLALAGASLATAGEPAYPAGDRFLAATGEARAPIGLASFCRSFPVECRRARDNGPVSLTPARWDVIVAVNAAVNREIAPVSDAALYGKDEVWTLPRSAGDCEDYALLKRQRLITAGIAPAALMIAVVFDENREGHAVLIARTDRGDLVLDNKTDRIVGWEETRYEFVKRQSAGDPRVWVRVADPRFNVASSATLR